MIFFIHIEQKEIKKKLFVHCIYEKINNQIKNSTMDFLVSSNHVICLPEFPIKIEMYSIYIKLRPIQTEWKKLRYEWQQTIFPIFQMAKKKCS